MTGGQKQVCLPLTQQRRRWMAKQLSCCYGTPADMRNHVEDHMVYVCIMAGPEESATRYESEQKTFQNVERGCLNKVTK